jgi:hypothetical protein
MGGASAVMGVTLLRDAGYSGPFRLSAYFDLCRRCKMQKDERDLLKVLKFELQFLEEGAMAVRRGRLGDLIISSKTPLLA